VNKSLNPTIKSIDKPIKFELYISTLFEDLYYNNLVSNYRIWWNIYVYVIQRLSQKWWKKYQDKTCKEMIEKIARSL